VKHNIISHTDNLQSGRLYVNGKNQKILNKKKALGQYKEEVKPMGIRLCGDYESHFQRDNSIFSKNNNVCANTYDSAHRFGVSHPFSV
jgi:hypothetical protein